MKSLILLFSTVCFFVQSLSLETIRVAYKDAAQNKTKVDALYKSLAKVTKKDKTELIAYKGATIALLAKQAKTIKEKKKGFIEGISLLEYAIKNNPNNIEARFIRLTIQVNTPKILKYKGQIVSDKDFILNEFNNIKDLQLKKYIKDFIVQSKSFTMEEKKVLN